MSSTMGRTAGKLRQQIAFEAARLMLVGDERDVGSARDRAARRLVRGSPGRGHLPAPEEIHRELEALAVQREATPEEERLYLARLEALALLRALRSFTPRLIGGVVDGSAGRGGLSLLLCQGDQESSENLSRARRQLEIHGIPFDDEAGGTLRVRGRCAYRVGFEPRGTAAGGAGRPPSHSVQEFEELLDAEYPWVDCHRASLAEETTLDRYVLYELLLGGLEDVKLESRAHPEGNALYHSLQVFDLVCREAPHDEELLLAALLHEIGRALDPADPLGATLATLDGLVSERTAYFIARLDDALSELDGTLGERARRELRTSPDHDELMLLARSCLRGRVRGASAPETGDALAHLRELASYGEEERQADAQPAASHDESDGNSQ